MKINRATIKEQARQLIKGNVFQLFLITIVVGVLTGGITSGIQSFSNVSNGFNAGFNDDTYSYSGELDAIDDIDDFGDILENIPETHKPSPFSAVTASFLGFSGLIALAFAPLSITLIAVYLALIRGRKMELGESFTYVFKTAFDKFYFNRFLTELLTKLFSCLWAILFIIPGIVYAYKVYFAEFIMAENPQLSWKEAIALSKRLTNSHKGELFIFDLSFILWYLLCGITLGLAAIYVGPYVLTAKALMYENFKARAMQEGAVTPNDFISEAARINEAAQNNVYQNPNPAEYQIPQYYAPQPEAPQYEVPQPQYQPPQENYYQPPQENYYQPPEE